MPTIEEVREQEQRLEREHQAALEQLRKLKAEDERLSQRAEEGDVRAAQQLPGLARDHHQQQSYCGDLHRALRATRQQIADAEEQAQRDAITEEARQCAAQGTLEDLEAQMQEASGQEAAELRRRVELGRDYRQVAVIQERQAEQERQRQAAEYTRKVEAEFTEALANTGWYLQPNREVQGEYLERALQEIQMVHGEAAADYCRRKVLPKLGPDSSLYTGAGFASSPNRIPRVGV